MTQAQLFLGLSIIFSALVGRVCFLASKERRSCFVLILLLVYGSILPTIAEIHLFNMEWKNWWWLIPTNHFIVVPILSTILSVIHVIIAEVIGLAPSVICFLVASVVFLFLGIR